jgi:hypothetical protein
MLNVAAARSLRILIPAAALFGCAGLSPWEPARVGSDDGEDGRTLTAIVAELQLHLRDDTYRRDRARTEAGQNVFALALWRLDRLQERRARPVDRWENIDIVIEFARARTLERLRRYADAAAAYLHVASTGSRLAGRADGWREIMSRFALHSGPLTPPPAHPEEALELIEVRISEWQGLALEYADTGFESLAREEAEAWEMVRLDWFARHRGSEEATAACRRLVERHQASKLYANHLIRLGDLYADAARQIYLRARAKLAPFDGERYETYLDHAFASYEMAGEARVGSAGNEAEIKIRALLAQHEGIRDDVP